MKKIFPVIAVLIILSLIGLIIIQFQWVNSLLIAQGDKILFKVDKASSIVAEDLSKSSMSQGQLRLQRKQYDLMPDNLSLGILRPLTIADRYSIKEIAVKLQSAFNNEGLQHLRYEFGITKKETEEYGTLEMQSKDFVKESFDTSHSRKSAIPISPGSGTDFEGLMSSYEHMIIIIPDFKTQVWQSLTWIIAGAVVFNLIIFAAFFVTIKTLIKQRRLNTIKSDFINNMTHELKTPLATISLAVDALKNEKVIGDKEKSSYFTGIIKDENKRMNKHVETILQAGLMDRQDLRINTNRTDAHTIIKKVLDTFALQMQEKGAIVSLFLHATNHIVFADEAHLNNLISNLVDNAIKYAKEKEPLQLKVTSQSGSKYFTMQFHDNGIGMNRDTVKRIFEKFYRAPTGNIHNVKGFGLGMSYVKTIVDAHKGRIKVDSLPGRGSNFTIDIPLADAAAG